MRYIDFNQMQALNGLENIIFFKYHWCDNGFHVDILHSTVSWDSDSITGRPLPRITNINTDYLPKQAVIKLKHDL